MMRLLKCVTIAAVLLVAPLSARAQSPALVQAVITAAQQAAGCHLAHLTTDNSGSTGAWSPTWRSNCGSGQVTTGNAAISGFNIPLWTGQQTYAAAIAGGIVVTSTSNPSGLDATYSLGVDPATGKTFPAEASDELVALLVTGAGNIASGTFLNGTQTQSWPDVSGVMHSFNPTQFASFTRAMGAYVQALVTAEQAEGAGGSPSWPSASVTIN